MILSHSKSFIYIHLEKCGGTSIENALEPFIEPHDIIIGSTDFGEMIQRQYFKQYGIERIKSDFLWKHSTADNICNYLGKDRYLDYFKFVTVREPVSLLLSYYSFASHVVKFNSPIPWKQLTEDDFGDRWPFNEYYVHSFIRTKNGTLNDFIADLLDNNNIVQYDRIVTENDIAPNMVVELPSLDKLWSTITDTLLVPRVELQRLNAWKYPETTINTKTERLVRSYFKKDYDLLPDLIQKH